MDIKTEALPNTAIKAEKLKAFFITHLKRVYCAKAHLQERMPEMKSYAHFTDLAHAISETLVDVEKQMGHLKEIFAFLEIEVGTENCEGIIDLIEDAFTAIYEEREDPEMRDLSILFYLHEIESIEMAAFKMLNMAAPFLEKKEIRQLLQENYDEAQEDLFLLRQITANYFKI
jgi:ferritin-like metal-binding protein YciE